MVPKRNQLVPERFSTPPQRKQSRAKGSQKWSQKAPWNLKNQFGWPFFRSQKTVQFQALSFLVFWALQEVPDLQNLVNVVRLSKNEGATFSLKNRYFHKKCLKKLPLGITKGTQKLIKRTKKAFRNGTEKSAANRLPFWAQKGTRRHRDAPSGAPVKQYILRKA